MKIEIATNFLNWHRKNFQLDRGNTGKIQGICKFDMSGDPATYILIWGANHLDPTLNII